MPAFKPMSAQELRQIAHQIGLDAFTAHPQDSGLGSLTRLLGISRASATRYANGQRKIPQGTARFLRAVAAYHLDLKTVFERTNKPFKSQKD